MRGDNNGKHSTLFGEEDRARGALYRACFRAFVSRFPDISRDGLFKTRLFFRGIAARLVYVRSDNFGNNDNSGLRAAHSFRRHGRDRRTREFHYGELFYLSAVAYIPFQKGLADGHSFALYRYDLGNGGGAYNQQIYHVPHVDGRRRGGLFQSGHLVRGGVQFDKMRGKRRDNVASIQAAQTNFKSVFRLKKHRCGSAVFRRAAIFFAEDRFFGKGRGDLKSFLKRKKTPDRKFT